MASENERDRSPSDAEDQDAAAEPLTSGGPEVSRPSGPSDLLGYRDEMRLLRELADERTADGEQGEEGLRAPEERGERQANPRPDEGMEA